MHLGGRINSTALIHTRTGTLNIIVWVGFMAGKMSKRAGWVNAVTSHHTGRFGFASGLSQRKLIFVLEACLQFKTNTTQHDLEWPKADRLGERGFGGQH